MDSLKNDINYSSLRSQKARVGKVFGGILHKLIIIAIGISIIGGGALIVLNYVVGWIVISIAIVLYVLLKWFYGELKQLPVSDNPKTIDDVLAGEILGHLPNNPMALNIATVVGKTNSALFMGARFGITPNTLQNIASNESVTSANIWKEAINICLALDMKEITGAIMAVAILKSFVGYEKILAHLNLDTDDLMSGIIWYERIIHLVKEHSKRKRTGGVARDWSFGYVPTLTRFGHNISEQITRSGFLSLDLESHAQAIDQMTNIFTKSGRQNVALVGPNGSGKTTIVHAFAKELLDASSKLPESLRFRQIFLLDASSILSAASGRGDIEGLVTRILNEAYSAKNIIICLDNAQLFFEEGVGSVDLTNLMLPILEAGGLRIIFTMDEQRYLQIGQRNPALINVLNRVSVAPTTKTETVAIMQDQLISTEFQQKVTYTYQSLEESYRLSERYVHDLAMPGRAIKLMESAAGFAENGLVTINSVQAAIERTMDIKVGVASGEEERDKLLNLENLIHKRMINQSRAVGVVSDALRRARAGVRNQNRPIGTFLFLGPTGVGKTELAKALADVYFGGENRIIRLDLNEYVNANDVTRLIADGASDASSLTAQVMKQPFSVILLDEIEKAHPNVLMTLLQLLDEGILRDIRNREVSFRDAIVIATSNAGADRIREYIERGYELEQFETHFINELINTNQFRPEFLNRFDEIVVFRPLTKPELVQVVNLILVGINKTLALQKVSVNVTDDAKELLVEKGYDPRLGARPMRRIIQRTVENTVAKIMLTGSVEPGSVIDINLEQVESIIGKKEEADKIAFDNRNRELGN